MKARSSMMSLCTEGFFGLLAMSSKWYLTPEGDMRTWNVLIKEPSYMKGESASVISKNICRKFELTAQITKIVNRWFMSISNIYIYI